jgi:hypothetical protein
LKNRFFNLLKIFDNFQKFQISEKVLLLINTIIILENNFNLRILLINEFLNLDLLKKIKHIEDYLHEEYKEVWNKQINFFYSILNDNFIKINNENFYYNNEKILKLINLNIINNNNNYYDHNDKNIIKLYNNNNNNNYNDGYNINNNNINNNNYNDNINNDDNNIKYINNYNDNINENEENNKKKILDHFDNILTYFYILTSLNNNNNNNNNK